MSSLKIGDPELFEILKREEKRQKNTINLIASENYPSRAVREAESALVMNKYSEGYPGKRYYPGNENVDQIENLAILRARQAFSLDDSWQVNVQPHSGSPANLAIYRALLSKGDKILAMDLKAGGHLTHGSKVNISGQDYNFSHYGVNPESYYLDYIQIEKLALEIHPKLIVCGATAYPRMIDFKKFKEIAKKVSAFLVADIAHVSGLIIGGVYPDPFPHCDVVMTTTHKTLRGSRGAIIFCKKELAEKINSSIFPGLQGGPHQHSIGAIAVALKEAQSFEFREYAGQIVKNARYLAGVLNGFGFNLVTGGTDNHLVLVDLRNKNINGKEAEEVLSRAGIIANRNFIPFDPGTATNPSGIRLGTPAVTSRGFKEREIEKVAIWINEVLQKPEKAEQIKKEVKKFCRNFPIR